MFITLFASNIISIKSWPKIHTVKCDWIYWKIKKILKNFENDGKLLTSSIDGAAAGAAAGAVVGADPPVVDGGDTALIITIIPNKTFGDSTVLYTSFGSLVIKLKSKSDLRLISIPIDGIKFFQLGSSGILSIPAISASI